MRTVKHPGLDMERIGKEETLLTELANGLNTLSTNQAKWMDDLIGQYEKNGALTDWAWEKINSMMITVRANATISESAPTEFRNFKSVLVMFQLAGNHLKRPKVVLANEKGARLRLTFNGPETEDEFFRNKVTIRYGNEDQSPINLGAIDVTSESFKPYRAGRNNPEHTKEALELVERFAEDPAGVAKASAAITGCCSYCNRALSDPRSKAVGYGPDCASHYGLPWGDEEQGTAKVYENVKN